ncbi:ATP-binding cassette domain-containing protein [Rathayibacter sp. VKM Ac-2803]|uniref:ABC transporter ATP-binding protein n=1 Tax=unclassified Rathayibacter TaxID=2609250 RepID=UPI00135C4D48|nr:MULTISPECIES: ATP-binding cassette domain-containing protein [unclassified Rathayibacter]MWV48668.1 ATP-binding cassette domain-containing protein [Rathayibacter sp. VKM Ac-2803]MWV60694.1 ATP-binding cassette domain-containing protein [Rathayibacter sp. VKM Ac-2754]
MILATDLTKGYGRRALWSGLDVTVASGSTLALTGASGSGKSTLLDCLGLLDAPDSGSIEVDGEEITRLRAGGRRRFRRHRLGYLFQSYALVDTATVEQNLAIALGERRGRAGRFESALDRVGLGGRGRERVSRLSGGEQQRVALARLLVKSPTVVLADEPTGALDAGNAAMVLDVLGELAGHGASVVVATHDDSVAGWCDARLHLSTPVSA